MCVCVCVCVQNLGAQLAPLKEKTPEIEIFFVFKK